MSRCCAKYILLLLLVVAMDLSVFSQNAQFSQFFATRIYQNPAFAGNTHTGRFSMQFRRQWPAVQGYTTYGAYYDHNLAGINSGIGISVLQDRQSGGALVYNKVSAMYAYGAKLRKKLYMRAGLLASYNTFDVDLRQFTFTDQLLSGSSNTVDDYRFDRKRYFDFNAGLLLYSESFWIGTSLSNLNNFERNPATLNNPFPMRFSAHGGVLIPINRDVKGNFLKSLTVAGHYKAQLLYDQFDLGAYYGYSVVLVGVWYRSIHGLKDNNATPANHDAIIPVVGINHKGIRLSYSFDISVSPLFTYSAGAHEFTLQWSLFEERQPKRRKRSERQVPCPDFGPGWNYEDTSPKGDE